MSGCKQWKHCYVWLHGAATSHEVLWTKATVLWLLISFLSITFIHAFHRFVNRICWKSMKWNLSFYNNDTDVRTYTAVVASAYFTHHPIIFLEYKRNVILALLNHPNMVSLASRKYYALKQITESSRFYALLKTFFWDVTQFRRYVWLDGFHDFKTGLLECGKTSTRLRSGK